MGLEHLALFRAVPESVVFYPADALATDACVQLAANHRGLVYLRTTRMATPAIYGPDEATGPPRRRNPSLAIRR